MTEEYVKIEIGNTRPENLKEYWPDQYGIFSYFEYVCGIPGVLFAVTTLKENGKTNINFHAWSCFQGDGGGFFAILAGIYRHTHTYENIARDKVFCVNFLPERYYDGLMKTVTRNEIDDDEFSIGGFHVENASSVAAPRIRESFISLECRCESITDLSGAGVSAMIVGKVLHAAVDEEYAAGIDAKYGKDGFMFYIHSPKNLKKGEGNISGVATMNVNRTC